MTMCYGFQRTDGNNPGSSAYSLLRPVAEHGQVYTPIVTFTLYDDGCMIKVEDVFERNIGMFLITKECAKLAACVRKSIHTSFTKRFQVGLRGHLLNGTTRLGWSTSGHARMEFTERVVEPGKYPTGTMETKVSIWLETNARHQLADYLEGKP